jgi:leader peptidase (prepilin peptidase)/N-methyltransferase
MSVAWYILIGIVGGFVGAVCLSMSKFIAAVEDGSACSLCGHRETCFAYRPLGKSNWLSELMLITYYTICKKCGYITKSSVKNVIIYVLWNVVLVMVLFWSRGHSVTSALFAIVVSALLALSVVDWNTQYIPLEMSGIILICGLIRVFADCSNWMEYVIGLFAVSGFLLIIDRMSTPILKKKYESEDIDHTIGDGDIKLMAATGLTLGWKLNFLALGIGCIAGSVIHLILMKIKKGERQFALGPYLSLGVYITMICGEQLVSWYLNMMGVKPL